MCKKWVVTHILHTMCNIVCYTHRETKGLEGGGSSLGDEGRSLLCPHRVLHTMCNMTRLDVSWDLCMCVCEWAMYYSWSCEILWVRRDSVIRDMTHAQIYTYSSIHAYHSVCPQYVHTYIICTFRVPVYIYNIHIGAFKWDSNRFYLYSCIYKYHVVSLYAHHLEISSACIHISSIHRSCHVKFYQVLYVFVYICISHGITTRTSSRNIQCLYTYIIHTSKL